MMPDEDVATAETVDGGPGGKISPTADLGVGYAALDQAYPLYAKTLAKRGIALDVAAISML